MDPATLTEAMAVTLYAGELLLRSGAETSRIEETMTRLLRHFGASEPDAVATVTAIYLSASDGLGYQTRVRRIQGGSLNLATIDAINDLSRRAEHGDLSLPEVRAKLQAIEHAPQIYTLPGRIAADLLTTAGFAILFNGNQRDLIAALPSAAVLSLVQLLLTRWRLPRLAVVVLAALSGALMGVYTAQALALPRPNIVILATVALLVPGAAIVSAIADLMRGHLLSGLARGAAAALIAGAIAAGVVVALALTNAEI
jgi:uncharacterized membrane protein YjjP (DUF1212 family)